MLIFLPTSGKYMADQVPLLIIVFIKIYAGILLYGTLQLYSIRYTKAIYVCVASLIGVHEMHGEVGPS